MELTVSLLNGRSCLVTATTADELRRRAELELQVP